MVHVPSATSIGSTLRHGRRPPGMPAAVREMPRAGSSPAGRSLVDVEVVVVAGDVHLSGFDVERGLEGVVVLRDAVVFETAFEIEPGQIVVLGGLVEAVVNVDLGDISVD